VKWRITESVLVMSEEGEERWDDCNPQRGGGEERDMKPRYRWRGGKRGSGRVNNRGKNSYYWRTITRPRTKKGALRTTKIVGEPITCEGEENPVLGAQRGVPRAIN